MKFNKIGIAGDHAGLELKEKVKTFLTVRLRKEPMRMYDDTLDVAVEVIQDFLNCDPMDIGKLQGATYDTVYNIEKEIDEN